MNKLEKNIKDYLHLYLGCECIYKSQKGIMYEIDSTGCRLKNVFGNGYIGFGLCKPILRPLSDMSDKELKKLQSWDYNSNPQNRLTPEGFKYILSKHFDLFGLIEAGLAIDKTKL